MRQIKGRRRWQRQVDTYRVANYANNLALRCWLHAVAQAGSNPFTQGVFVRKKSPREGFVNDHSLFRVARITGIEISAKFERNFHGPEILACNDVWLGP